MPAVDGLRAIAVLAVFFYHAGVDWMPGGFLGVDVFFVISGYLITALLVGEFERNGYIDVVAFWLRRARRLLPAVAVMIAVTMVVGLIFVPSEVSGLRDDAIASLFYVNNWHLIFTDQSYFETFARPSLFRHLWSLSVEEQFYLLWPIVCALGLRRFGKRNLMIGSLVGAGLSAILMAVLFDPEVNGAARVFYGTDTRASALLLGVALAVVWHPSQLPFRDNPRIGRLLNVVGAVALLLVLRDFFVVDDFQESLYHGGFLLLAIWSALLVGVLAHPQAQVGWLLSRAPVVWLGVRSYGFYLWHWPVVTLTRPDIDVPLSGAPLITLQLLATIGLAELSYRYVEQPFRRRNSSPSSPAWLRTGRFALAAAVALTVLVVGWSGIAPSGGDTPAAAQEAAVEEGPATVVPVKPAKGTKPGELPEVLAVGDSVMEAADAELSRQLGNVTIDADEARLPSEYPGILATYRDSGALPDHVVIQIGNNGPVYDEDIAAIREALGDVPHVYLVNVEVPRSWEDEVNEELASAVEDWPEATLVDWNGALDGRTDLTYDGIHPNPEGDVLYANGIRTAIEANG